MTGVLIRKPSDRRHRDTERHTGKAAMGRQRQRLECRCHKSRNTCSHQKLEEARKDSSLEPSEGAWPCQPLDFRRLASRTVRESISAVSHSLSGNLLWQLQGTNTDLSTNQCQQDNALLPVHNKLSTGNEIKCLRTFIAVLHCGDITQTHDFMFYKIKVCNGLEIKKKKASPQLEKFCKDNIYKDAADIL